MTKSSFGNFKMGHFDKEAGVSLEDVPQLLKTVNYSKFPTMICDHFQRLTECSEDL